MMCERTVLLPEDLQLKILHQMMKDRSVASYRAGLLTCQLFKRTLTKTYSDSVRLQTRLEKYLRQALVVPYGSKPDILAEMWLGFQANMRLSFFASRQRDRELVLYNVAVPAETQLTAVEELERALGCLSKTTDLVYQLTYELDMHDHVELLSLLKSRQYSETKIERGLFPNAVWMSKAF